MNYEKNNILITPFYKRLMDDNYFEWFNKPEVTEFNSHGKFPLLKEDFDDFFTSLKSKNKIVWAIFFKHHHIGNISLQSIDWINRTGEIAIIIGNNKYHNNGIGSQVFKFVFYHGFAKLNINKIWLGTASTNKGMIKIAEKLGMSLEGILRDHVYLNGKFVSIQNYGILKDEWRRRKNS
jgi:RimJ/RimL family protein N-acetyltransferase